jgi:hypothetical protein
MLTAANIAANERAGCGARRRDKYASHIVPSRTSELLARVQALGNNPNLYLRGPIASAQATGNDLTRR